MDDRDFEKQIHQMCEFIMLEAREKSNEIHLKTEHDFNLEKQMMVHNSKLKLQQDFKRKEKDMETQKRISQANAIGKARIRQMVAREELIQAVKSEAVSNLDKMTHKGQETYSKLLRDLITQGLVKLNEKFVVLVVRKEDVSVVEGVVKGAVSDYIGLIKEATGEDVTCDVTVNKKVFLPPAPKGDGARSCAGGLKLTAARGRIVCDNTLDSRLQVAFQNLMPTIRSSLFGAKV